MNRMVFATGVALTLLCAGAAYAVKCLEDPGDAAQIAAARTAVDSACTCFCATSHGAYVACVAGVVNTQVGNNLLRPQCKGAVKQIYAKSVCGKPGVAKDPFVPCVSTNTHTGKVRCAIKRNFACASSGNNTSRECFASTTCLDAADTNGDLQIDDTDRGACTTANTLNYHDNGDGTISDTNGGRGLMWEQLDDNNANGIHDYSATFTWDNAFKKIQVLNGNVAGCIGANNPDACCTGAGTGSCSPCAGYTDWRVPTIAELQTLLGYAGPPYVAPAFNTNCTPGCTVTTCSCTQSNPYWLYWSSTTWHYDPTAAWYVEFGEGGYVYIGTKSYAGGYVRGVRGGS